MTAGSLPAAEAPPEGEGGEAGGATRPAAPLKKHSSWVVRSGLVKEGSWLHRSASRVQDYFAIPPEAMTGEPMNGGINPLTKSYIHPSDLTWPRYVFMAILFGAGVAWWLGPILSMFLVDPLIQLGVTSIQVITPQTDCYDYKQPHLVCPDAGIASRYFFYNVTNVDAWIAGTEPPNVQEVGPYVFRVTEIRYNTTFTQNWTQVSWNYHTYEEFDEGRSCPGCRPTDTLTLVNRAYQQYLTAMRGVVASMQVPAAATPPSTLDNPPIPADQIKLLFLPSIMVGLKGGLEAMMEAAFSATPSNKEDMALQQWANCAVLQAVPPGVWAFYPPGWGPPFVFIDPADPAGFHFHPEFCYYLDQTISALDSGIDLAAAKAWMGAVMGGSTLMMPDPAAQAFIARFLLLSKATHQAALRALPDPAPTLADSLDPITDTQWNLLKGYLMYLAGTYGNETYWAVGASVLPMIDAAVDAEKARWGGMAKLGPESAIEYGFLPIAIKTVIDAMTGAMQPTVDAGWRSFLSLAADAPLPDAYRTLADQQAADLARQQWADCSVMPGSAALPVGPGAFPHPPEFCAFLLANAATFGFTFPVTPAMFPDLGLTLTADQVKAFLEAVVGTTTATAPDAAAAGRIQAFMMAPTKAAALLAAPAQAARLAGVSDTAWKALSLWLINLLPTWGKLVYTSWLHAMQPGPGAGGLVVTRTVFDHLYGFDDNVMITLAQQMNPAGYRFAPWVYRPFISPSFPNATYPLDYFGELLGRKVEYHELSYRPDTGVYHAMVSNKRLVTGAAKNDFPQNILAFNGAPFGVKPRGIFNATGMNEGVVQGSNFKTSAQPIQYETALARPLKSTFTGRNLRTRGVKAYQMTLHPTSFEPCNETAYTEWKAATGFDEMAFQDAMADLKAKAPSEYWYLMANDTALTAWLNSTTLGPLSRYFADKPSLAWLAQCANPERLTWAWDMSATWANPTLYTLPRFYHADADVVQTTGRPAPESNFGEHGWYFSVEPFTGMSIMAHKPYQNNLLVSKTDVAYPDLWVSPGSKNTSLGRALGMQDDFVLVPLSVMTIGWEPTRKASLALITINTAKEVMYWLLIAGCPVFCWLFLFPTLIYLKFSKSAKVRKREMAEIHRSRARNVRLGKHEAAMAEALSQIAKGVKPAYMPPERRWSDDSDDEASSSRASEISLGGASSGDATASLVPQRAKRDSAFGPGAARAGPSRLSGIAEEKVAAAERAAAAAEAEQAGGHGGAAFSIPAGGAGEPYGFGQPAGVEEEATAGQDEVAVNLLPDGALGSSSGASAADRAALESYRRSHGGSGLGGGLGGSLRRRTTSTPEEP